jgi:hypothetical protein
MCPGNQATCNLLCSHSQLSHELPAVCSLRIQHLDGDSSVAPSAIVHLRASHKQAEHVDQHVRQQSCSAAARAYMKSFSAVAVMAWPTASSQLTNNCKESMPTMMACLPLAL